ncbi:MAG TPA: hypothetical protein VIS06_08590 [Mycobacteriales bacterium]
MHTLLDTVPVTRRADMVRHALDVLVEPGGRLLVSHYQPAGGSDLGAPEHLRGLGFPVAGESTGHSDRRASTAWIDVPTGIATPVDRGPDNSSTDR